MNYLGKFQMYYTKIQSVLVEIKEQFAYQNLSKAFAHWYFENAKGMNQADIAEAIIDAHGDNGIDAIIVEEECMVLYQFKFPDKNKNVEKCIDEKTVLKLFNGYNKLISSRKPRVANFDLDISVF